LVITPLLSGVWAWLVYLILSVLLVVLVTVLSSATARLKLNQAFKLYWGWGAVVALFALVIAVIG
jgi:formate hydrogenlyase subunit 4